MDKHTLTQHISHRFNEELESIVDDVLVMGGVVEQQLEEALRALVEGDTEAGERVISRDYLINAQEVDLDERCTQILARRQPAASDLRLVMAVIKAITDLERIGDESERIGKMAMRLTEQDRRRQPLDQINALGDQVRQMLRGALDCFARMDAQAAVRVAEEDIATDQQYEALMRLLVGYMEEHPDSIAAAMDLVWSARSLERIGDRSRNICEYVIYFVKGKDVRHTSFEQMAREAAAERG